MSFERRQLAPQERECFETGIEALELVVGAPLAALVFVNERGAFLSLRGGCEHKVARLLETVDWKSARMITDEHIA